MNSKNRFRFITFLTVTLCVWAIGTPGADAHLPETVAPLYDSDTNILTLYITHPVADPETHYIHRVEILLNGSIFETHNYISQPTKDGFIYEYPIVANNGTVIRVVAFCSISGSNSGEITVGESEEPGDGGPGDGESNTIELSTAPILLLSIIGVLFLARSHTKKQRARSYV